ncbi:MAG: ribonuclease R [Planctomycetota bacterium]
MPSRYTQRILSHIADRRYEPTDADALADALSIPDDQRDEFCAAIDHLLDNNQVVLSQDDEIGLPPPSGHMDGIFRKHPNGFGFFIPDQLVEHGDLFVPPPNVGDALTGDRVRIKVHKENRGGGGKSPWVAKIVEVLKRADRKYAGTLEKKGRFFQVAVDGRMMTEPIVVRDISSKNARPGDKVVVEIIKYGDARQNKPAEGVIVEVLGEAGEPDVETQAVMHAFGLAEAFDDAVLAEARDAANTISDDIPDDREDLTDTFIATIDPPTAKDFDDAISINKLTPGDEKDGAAWELGVHIADVAAFVLPGSALEAEAYARGNSTYLPKRVIPMLPEVLSNGVCSLQPDVPRYAKSCFIRYDRKGKPLSARFAKSVINSKKRLTYLEAQALIDDDLKEAIKHCRQDSGGTTKYPRELIQKLKQMDELAKTIRKRRMDDGMIVLGLPAVELVFDDAGRVVDAEPEDDAFTHTIIEMFMVEANEAAARLFDRFDVPMIRRTHPDPDAHGVGELQQFARVAGFNIPSKPNRKELQQLLDAVRGKPQQTAVHIAVLRTMTKAEYSPNLIGHFALASEHYTHFTSPIRRYPDLIVHRGINAALDAIAKHPKNKKAVTRAMEEDPAVPDFDKLVEIGRHCSTTERNSSDAERELRNYLVLELLAEHLGDDFAGTVSGVTGNGVFIQIDKYLVDGFVAVRELPQLPQDRWQFNRQTGALVAQRSGKTISIGDRFTVRVAAVDLARRQMDLAVVEPETPRPGKRKLSQGKNKKSTTKAKTSGGKSGKPANTGKSAKSGKRPKNKTKAADAPRDRPRGKKNQKNAGRTAPAGSKPRKKSAKRKKKGR